MLTIWLSFSLPYVETVSPEPGKQEIICHFPLLTFIASIIFNGILLIICAVFAFMTRKLPDNFNESRFIAFFVYSTLIIWIAIIPAYLTATTSSLKVGLLSTCLILNATVPLLVIFIPKLYAVHFVNTDSLHVKKSGLSHTHSRCPECLDMVAPDLVSTSSVHQTRGVSRCMSSRHLPDATITNKVAPIMPKESSICETGEGAEGWM